MYQGWIDKEYTTYVHHDIFFQLSKEYYSNSVCDRKHGLLYENLRVRHRLTSGDVFVREISLTLKTTKAIAITLVGPLYLDGMTLLLKTNHILTKVHRK